VIEYLGRLDNQVQLRGFRIELGEIEAVLAQHPMVAGAVAVVREDEPEDERLVGYVVPVQGPVSPSALRQYLQQRLPDYMVPGHFVMLDALPLTPNGKIDRKRLPIPEGGRGGLETEFIAPQTPIQIELAEIWREVLKVGQVGVHDNFFELGGHSLLATQVVSRVCQAFEVELSLRVFFEKPTVAGLTEVLENYETVPGRASAIAQILEKIDAMDAKEIRKMLHDKRKR
jgi:acyl carrier protein